MINEINKSTHLTQPRRKQKYLGENNADANTQLTQTRKKIQIQNTRLP
jgi:hypothetical protein